MTYWHSSLFSKESNISNAILMLFQCMPNACSMHFQCIPGPLLIRRISMMVQFETRYSKPTCSLPAKSISFRMQLSNWNQIIKPTNIVHQFFIRSLSALRMFDCYILFSFKQIRNNWWNLWMLSRHVVFLLSIRCLFIFDHR